MEYTYEDIAKTIDHSLLNPTLTAADMELGCRLALDYDVASVCILPYYLSRCSRILAGSQVKASTTIGFPHGCHTTAVKVAEAGRALADGGQELDMVVNISAVLSGDWRLVREDLEAVIAVTHAAGQRVKVIFENCYLNDAQKIRLCEIFERVGCGLGEDVHRIRQRGRHDRGPGADAQARRAAGAGEVGRRHSRSGFAAGGARRGRDSFRCYAHGINAG